MAKLTRLVALLRAHKFSISDACEGAGPDEPPLTCDCERYDGPSIMMRVKLAEQLVAEANRLKAVLEVAGLRVAPEGYGASITAQYIPPATDAQMRFEHPKGIALLTLTGVDDASFDEHLAAQP